MLFRSLSDGAIRNGYTIKVLNMKTEPRSFRLSIDGLPGATLEMVGEDGKQVATLDVAVEADKLRAIKVYVTTSDPRVLAAADSNFQFHVAELAAQGETESGSFKAIFHAPGES